MRAALDFLRAPVFLMEGALLHGLVDLRDQVPLLGGDRLGITASTALSRRRKWVFTVLVSSRFSVSLALAA